jgi:general stress protein CsbA
MKTRQKNNAEKEFIADLLKERIYATLALLAVLISIDSDHVSPINAGFIIVGTIVSLWAASIVATQMSRRMVFKDELDHSEEVNHQIRRHAPMLASLVFPLIMISLSAVGAMTLSAAIDISILSSMALLIGWSIGSARSLGSNRVPMLVLVAVELAIGLGVVGLKLVVGH